MLDSKDEGLFKRREIRLFGGLPRPPRGQSPPKDWESRQIKREPTDGRRPIPPLRQAPAAVRGHRSEQTHGKNRQPQPGWRHRPIKSEHSNNVLSSTRIESDSSIDAAFDMIPDDPSVIHPNFEPPAHEVPPDWQCYGYAGPDNRLLQPRGTRPIPLPLPERISHRVRGETGRPNRTPPSFNYNDLLGTPSKTPSKRPSRPGTPGSSHHRHDRHLTDSQRKKLAASIQHDRTIVDANYDDDSDLDWHHWDGKKRKNRKDREQRKK